MHMAQSRTARNSREDARRPSAQVQPHKERALWNFLTWSFFLAQILAADQLVGGQAKAAGNLDLSSSEADVDASPLQLDSAMPAEGWSSADLQETRIIPASAHADGAVAASLKASQTDGLTIILDAVPQVDSQPSDNAFVAGTPAAATSEQAFTEVTPSIANHIHVGLPDVVGTVVDPVLDTVENVLETLDDVVGGIADPLIGTLDETIENIVDPLLGTVETVVGALDNTVESVVDPLLGTVETVVGALDNTVESVVDPLLGTVETLVSSLDDTFNTVTGPLLGTLGDVVPDLVADLGNNLIDAVDGTVEPLLTTAQTLVGALDETLDTVIDPLLGAVGDTVPDVMTAMTGGLHDVIETVAHPLVGITNVATTGIEILTPPLAMIQEPAGLVGDALASAGELTFSAVTSGGLDDLFVGGRYTDYNLALQDKLPLLSVGSSDAAGSSSGLIVDVLAAVSNAGDAVHGDADSESSPFPHIAIPGILDELGLRGLGDGIV